MTPGAHGTPIAELVGLLQRAPQPRNRHERRALAVRKRAIVRAIDKKIQLSIARSIVKLGRAIRSFCAGRA